MRNPALSLGVALATQMLAGGCATRGQAVDTTVSAAVEARMAADPDASSFDVDVETVDGIVTLRGDVENETERTAAERIARDTDGVLGVRNLLVLEKAERAEEHDESSDARIRAAVGSRLLSNPDMKQFQIDVDVEDGVVTLSGVVDSEAARQRAEDVVRNTAGVRRVANELTVAEPPTPPPVTMPFE